MHSSHLRKFARKNTLTFLLAFGIFLGTGLLVLHPSFGVLSAAGPSTSEYVSDSGYPDIQTKHIIDKTAQIETQYPVTSNATLNAELEAYIDATPGNKKGYELSYLNDQLLSVVVVAKLDDGSPQRTPPNDLLASGRQSPNSGRPHA
ncbi:hypothetical protein CEPID_07950 [Corynebacterium epidermidicanis]|uniref:Uncharacterized protein n=1 Tax=Corynebacterium epidermidicanis TaxID=1050174 RepID=A0A0G3GS88_9CORY|nr:hypothetical protein CEPID_07950 [Corynebacterium epidermidicanis]